MMSKLEAGLVTIIGILLALPLLGVDQLGSLTEGAAAWVVAIIILVIGIMGLFNKEA